MKYPEEVDTDAFYGNSALINLKTKTQVFLISFNLFWLVYCFIYSPFIYLLGRFCLMPYFQKNMGKLDLTNFPTIFEKSIVG